MSKLLGHPSAQAMWSPIAHFDVPDLMDAAFYAFTTGRDYWTFGSEAALHRYELASSPERDPARSRTVAGPRVTAREADGARLRAT